MSYIDAFDQLIAGNYTDTVVTGYVSGAGMGPFFWIFMILIPILATYLKTESYTLTGLVTLVLGGAGLFSNISGIGGEALAGINITAIFGILMAFGFGIVLIGLLGRRE